MPCEKSQRPYHCELKTAPNVFKRLLADRVSVFLLLPAVPESDHDSTRNARVGLSASNQRPLLFVGAYYHTYCKFTDHT